MEIHSSLELHINSRIQKLINWESPVARAAPAVPMSSPKIKIGSKTMFNTPPVVIPTMANNAFPWKRSRLFIIKEHIINGAATKI